MQNQPTPKQAWLGNMQAGKQYFQQGNPGQAAQAFARAVHLFPERVESWINLGSALLESGRFDETLIAVDKVLALDSKLMLPHLIAGDALRQLGKWPEAVASYRKALSLQRTPLSLNKLACALRVEEIQEEAEWLYQEALEMEPGFTLARVNLAALQVERGRYDKAMEQLSSLAGVSLPPPERAEVDSVQSAVLQYSSLNEAIATMNQEDQLGPLETALRELPGEQLQVDEKVLGGIERYADAARQHSVPAAIEARDLPGDWGLIEAMFMIPHVNTVSEYLAAKAELAQGSKATGDLLESINMESVIHAASSAQQDMQDPVKAELQLRHWHALACREVTGFMPGHFKYTQNWAATNPGFQRVDPARASGTLRRFVSDLYPGSQPGLARAALVCMAVCDLHLFADGNGRIGMTWLNRELEWAGLAPALFSRELGIKGALGDARREVRNNGGDLSPLFSVITSAQQYGLDFCAELAACQ